MLVGQSDFYGVEVLALQVLDQSQLHHVLVVDGTDVGGNGFKPSQLGGTPTALAGNNLIPVIGHLSQRDRLDDAQFAYACSQFVESFLVKLVAWLVRVGFYLVEGNLVDGRRPARPYVFG